MPSRTLNGTTVWLGLLRACQAMDQVARSSMDDVGLGFSDFVLLEALLHGGTTTPGVLSEKVGLTSGAITAALDRLEDRGMVERSRSASDGRSRLVALTDSGRAVIEPAYAAHAADIERVMSAALGDEDKSTLFRLLRAVRRAAEEEVS